MVYLGSQTHRRIHPSICLSFNWILAIIVALPLVWWSILEIVSNHPWIWRYWLWYDKFILPPWFFGIQCVDTDQLLNPFQQVFLFPWAFVFGCHNAQFKGHTNISLRRPLLTRLRWHFQHATSHNHSFAALCKRMSLQMLWRTPWYV